MGILICDARTVSLEVHATRAPTPGARLTRHDVQDDHDSDLIAALEHGPWEVVEVVPIEDCPSRVRVYARLAEPVVGAGWDWAGIPGL